MLIALLRLMDRLTRYERLVKFASLLAIAGLAAVAIHSYQTKKRDWQVEAEGIVQTELPLGTSRARVAKWFIVRNYRKDKSTPEAIHVHILYRQLQHKPNAPTVASITGIGLEDNAVAVEIRFDSSQKVAGYGAAYTTYVPYVVP